MMNPKDYPCPTCSARPGCWCKRPSGHSGPFVASHATRVRLCQAAHNAHQALMSQYHERHESQPAQLTMIEGGAQFTLDV